MSNFNPNLNRFNLNQNHQLSQRQQTYFLERKLVSIHSEDRDTDKWPFSNTFEVHLPQPILNVQSMRLVEIKLPANYYNFSILNQNTKMSFSFDTVNVNWSGPSSPDPAIYAILANAGLFTIQVENGFFNPNQITIDIQNRMNDIVTQYLAANGISYIYNKFVVFNDTVGQKIFFGNSCDSFILHFSKQEFYDIPDCGATVTFFRPNQWGMPANLGYKKLEYFSDASTNSLKFYWAGNDVSSCIWLSPSTSPVSNEVFFVTPSFQYDLFYISNIYMEIEKYNSMDELYAYPNQVTVTNSQYGGIVDGAFAKIPLTTLPYGQVFDSRNGFLQNMTVFETPLERISKLKFKFRDHYGSPIDWQNFPFDFTLEFYCFKNEIGKNYEIRVPFTYTL